MQEIETMYHGTLTAKRVKYPPKTATLLYCDYINENGLFGSSISVYFTGKKYYFTVSNL